MAKSMASKSQKNGGESKEPRQPEDAGIGKGESDEALHERVQEGQRKAEDAGEPQAPPEPKTI